MFLESIKKLETKQIWNWNFLLSVIFATGSVGIALKFITTIIQCNLLGVQRFVYFPVFPNVLDSTFICLGSIYFLWDKIKGIKKSNVAEE